MRIVRSLAMVSVMTLLIAACGGGTGASTTTTEGDASVSTGGNSEASADTTLADASDDDPSDSEEGEDSEEIAEPTKLRVALASPVIGPHLSMNTSVPAALGFWEEEGLDVELVLGQGSGVALSAIVGNQADLAIVGGVAALQAIQQNDEPFVIFYFQSQRDLLDMAVLADSEYESMADLEGATIGVPDLSSQAVLWAEAALAAAGVDPEGVTFVAIGQGPAAAAAFGNGQVDAVAESEAPLVLYESVGLDIRRLENPLKEQLAITSAVTTTREFMEQEADALARWARGIAKATVWTAANPEEAVRIHYAAFPDSRPDGTDEEVISDGVALLEARLANLLVTDPDGRYGYVDDERLEFSIDFLVESGSLDEPLEIPEFYDASLIDIINDFDLAAVDQLRP